MTSVDAQSPDGVEWHMGKHSPALCSACRPALTDCVCCAAYTTMNGSGKSSSKQHVIHDIGLEKLMKGRYVRVAITKLGTAWGASLWELQVYGRWLD